MAVEVGPEDLRNWVNSLPYGRLTRGWVNGKEVGVMKVPREVEGGVPVGYMVRVMIGEGIEADDDPVLAYKAVVGLRGANLKL